VRFSPERSVFLSTAPGAAINFGLALAAASLSIVLQEHVPHADLTRVLSHDGSRKAAQAIDKAMRLSNEEFDAQHRGPRTIGERARIIGGIVTVESRPGFGARVEVAVPLTETQN